VSDLFQTEEEEPRTNLERVLEAGFKAFDAEMT